MRIRIFSTSISLSVLCLLFVACYLYVLPVASGVTSFSVEVRAEHSKQPIQNASVTLRGHTEKTNNFGLAKFSNVWFDEKDEAAVATVQATGYQSRSVNINAKSEGATLQVFLEKDP